MGRDRFDVIFCDLVPHAIAALRLLTGAKIIFYCHFPDQLVAPQRGGWYRWYRAPIDRLEEVTTGMAHRIVVNSEYTAAAFRRVFPRLRGCALEVIYPGVDTARYDQTEDPARPNRRNNYYSVDRPLRTRQKRAVDDRGDRGVARAIVARGV